MNDAAIALFLFVANDGSRSIAAIENIRVAIVEMPDRHFELEIVNVCDDPDRAWSHRVLVTPTLLAPISARRLVGDLSQRLRLRYRQPDVLFGERFCAGA
jgi:circadian clock protein KaiB